MNGFSVTAMQHMTALALKFELHTGNRIRWRNAPAGIAAILNLSFQSGKPELAEMAARVLDSLSVSVLDELESRGLAIFGSENVYRGSAMIEVAEKPEHAPQGLVYRGAEVLTGSYSLPEEAAPVKKKSQRIYRGRVVED